MSYREWMWKEASVSKGGNTFNLLTHLKRHHLKQYAELIQAQEKKKSEKSSKVTEGQTKLKAVNQSVAKYGRGSKKWQELTDSVSYCIAKI